MPTKYTVRTGDCINSIADTFGFFPNTLWNHPDNAALRRLRESPDVLCPGDTVVVPDKRVVEYPAPTGQRHTFRRKGVPAKLKLRVRDVFSVAPEAPPPFDPANPRVEGPRPQRPEERPLARVPYALDVDGVKRVGETDGEGNLEVSIPPRARAGTLVLRPGTPEERRIALRFGHLEPISTLAGTKQRLANLGIPVGPGGEARTEELARALRLFQIEHGLPVTGEDDPPTRSKLLELHGA